MRSLVPLALGLILMASPVAGQDRRPLDLPVSQFYLLSFDEAPVAEVAEAVVGGALSQAVAVDPAIAGTISFKAEGSFTAQALLEEFGTAALDADLALIRSRAGDLAVVPRADMGRELARGGRVIARSDPAPALPTELAPAVAREPITYGQARWWEGPAGAWLLFLSGGLTGALALRSGQAWARRQQGVIKTAPAALTYRPTGAATVEAASADPDLVIPRFETRLHP